jgi:CheY-like chemotaxis protein
MHMATENAIGASADRRDPPPRSDPGAKAPSVRRRDPIRILVADSEDCIGDAIATMLPGDDEEVRLVRSGRETLAALANEPFDVLIVCATLADMDFIDLIWKVKRGSKPAPRIIAASPGGDACCGCAGACAVGQGIDGFLHKPFTQEEFLETLDGALAGNFQA